MTALYLTGGLPAQGWLESGGWLVFGTPLALFAGFLLDLLIGDPHALPHPVQFIGWLIQKLEGLCRAVFFKGTGGQLAAGAALAVLVMAVSTLIPYGILYGAVRVHPLLAVIVEAVMCYQILAVKSLKTESMKVHRELEKDDIAAARQKVAMIVGRDTDSLDASQIAKAAVETVAENTSDGVIAPLLFLAIGGAPLGFFYKSINTMDSMIGYKNDKYLYFGRFAARLDDVVNFIPARLSALFMIVAAFLLGMDGKGAVRVFRRDRFNHASPNSAQTEAVCAGALQVQLAGNACYFGKLYEKETIGDDIRPVAFSDIEKANRLMYAAALLAMAVCLAVTGVFAWLI